MIPITITVSKTHAEMIIRIGSIPWSKATDQEKDQYNHLIDLFGTAVSQRILAANGQNRR